MKERISQIVFTGTNYGVRYPTNRFFDFNLSRDFDAFRALLESGIRMTAIPCNVCRRLRLRHKMLEEFRGPLGEHLQQESRRWFTRARILKLSKSVPAWDVVTALYSRTPPLFRVETHGILIRGKNVFFEYSERTIDVVTDFDQDKVWEFYFSLFR